MQFGRETASALLEANPGIRLHQMHDAAQDELMLARMTYFRVKWATLPDGYAEFLTERRHVFQVGGRGGVSPGDYLNRPHRRNQTTTPLGRVGIRCRLRRRHQVDSGEPPDG